MSSFNTRRIPLANIINSASQVPAARGKFIVASISNTNGFSVSAAPVVHDDATAARNECVRLSKLNPGKTFVFLQIAGGELTPVAPTSF